jgi:ribosomal subunit interface protein
MTFPTINTKATNITITPALSVLIDQKFTPLGRLVNDQEKLFCEIELEKIGEHQSGKIYRAEVNFSSGGKLFRSEATEEQIEKAIDEVRNELKKELERAHGKRHSLFKRGKQAIKDMLRFGGTEE